MKRLTKVLATTLAATTMLAMMPACGGSEGTSQSGNTGSTVSQSQSDTASGQANSSDEGGEVADSGKMAETTKISVTFVTQNKSEDVAMVQDAINAISIPAINVEVELTDITIVDAMYASYYTLGISAGTQMDLILIPYTSLSNYVSTNQLEPIDELIDNYAPTIKSLSAQYPMLDACKVQGVTYGVDPLMQVYGDNSGISIRKDMMDETGIDTTDRVMTLQDIDGILAAIKANHPDMYPFTFANMGSSNFGWFNTMDTLGASGDGGVVMGMDSTTVVNPYETQEYLDFLKLMRSWYEKGYILPDMATTDMTATDLLQSGKCVVTQMATYPGEDENAAKTYGGEWYIYRVQEPHIASASSTGSCHWAIPITSASPEAAIRFLDLMYADSRVAQLFFSGIEGTHYVDKGDHLEYPEGQTYETVGYQNAWGLYGDNRQIKFFTVGATREANDAYTAKNLAHPTKVYGYMFDTTDYETDIMALNTVLTQYVKTLECGCVEDYEGTLAEMNKKLHSAGLDKVMAANQEQLNAWLAAQQ